MTSHPWSGLTTRQVHCGEIITFIQRLNGSLVHGTDTVGRTQGDDCRARSRETAFSDTGLRRPGGNRDRPIALTFRRPRSVDKLQIAMG